MNQKITLSGLDLSDCILLHPKCSERIKRTISIMRNGEMRLNSQFMKEFDLSVSNYATVFLLPKENGIVLLVQNKPSDTSVYIKKNGYAMLADAVEQLESRGIKLPACFSVSEKDKKDEGTVWLAIHDANYHFPEVKVSKQKLSKPRKHIPSEVLP
ncbi:hypothetical protein [Gemmiger sp.]